MKADCREYSKTRELLSLRIRLEKGIADPEEREETETRIRILEKELKLD